MATFNWSTPANPDNDDTTTQLSLGLKFTSSAAVNCTGVNIWVPSTLPSAPSPAFVSLWPGAGGSPLATGEFEWSDFVGLEGTFQNVVFDDPPVMLATGGTEYVVVVQTYEKWGGTPSFSWPVTVGHLTAVANNGWIKLSYGFPDIESPADQNYGLSPVTDSPLTVVSNSFDLQYSVRQSVSQSVGLVHDILQTVSKSPTIQYNVRQSVSKSVAAQYDTLSDITTVSKSVDLSYDTRFRISKSFAVQHSIRSRVSKSLAVQHGVRKIMTQGKVFSVQHDVRKRTSNSFSLRYGVRVPIASSKSVSAVYDIRQRMQKSFSLQHDTEAVGATTVSKAFQVIYHTLVTPGDSADGVSTTPTYPDPVPPQIVTTSFK